MKFTDSTFWKSIIVIIVHRWRTQRRVQNKVIPYYDYMTSLSSPLSHTDRVNCQYKFLSTANHIFIYTTCFISFLLTSIISPLTRFPTTRISLVFLATDSHHFFSQYVQINLIYSFCHFPAITYIIYIYYVFSYVYHHIITLTFSFGFSLSKFNDRHSKYHCWYNDIIVS